MYPQPIQKLIELFSQFPGVGPRTASRFVFYLLKSSDQDIEKFIASVQDLKKKTGICELCFNPFSRAESSSEDRLCPICSNASRNQGIVCIVEKESDLEAIEKTNTFKGLYFVLGGTLGQLRKEDLSKLRVKELKARVAKEGVKEVILALNPTTEGEATALYLEGVLKPLLKKITKLGRGLPMGGEVEYADEETLRQALEGRR